MVNSQGGRQLVRERPPFVVLPRRRCAISHIAAPSTKPGQPIYRDVAALAEAARRLGGELIERTTYRWYGRSVGDYPLPPGFDRQTLGSNAKYVIRLTEETKQRLGLHDPYEIGIVEDPNNPGCYLPMYDYWSGGKGLDRVFGPPVMAGPQVEMLAPRLLQLYHMVCDTWAAAEAGDQLELLTLQQASQSYPNDFPPSNDQDTWVSIAHTQQRLGVSGLAQEGR